MHFVTTLITQYFIYTKQELSQLSYSFSLTLLCSQFYFISPSPGNVLNKFKKLCIFIICVWVFLLESMFMYHVHVVSPEARRWHQILWNWSYTQFARTYHGLLQEQ